MNILILGVNGFIGSNLSEFILANKDWSIYGMDVQDNKLEKCLGHPRFHFLEGDITINREWIEYHVKKCDVVIPLVAIATPAAYIKNPIGVFELAFESNLQIVRHCLRYGKRVVFPSTSEVYGMSSDKEFSEETSNLVLGPVNKQRWIYACSKQLMDRVIYAYGQQNGLKYSLFRPFNWIGPKLDDVWANKEGSARVISQFIGNILRGQNLDLVNGGRQKRSFIYIDDAIECLAQIIENKLGCADQRIFNIGNPSNDWSIAQLAETLLDMIATYPGFGDVKSRVKLNIVQGQEYYGAGYEDTNARVPSIANAKNYLGWQPRTDMKTAIQKTLDYYLIGDGAIKSERKTASGLA